MFNEKRITFYRPVSFLIPLIVIKNSKAFVCFALNVNVYKCTHTCIIYVCLTSVGHVCLSITLYPPPRKIHALYFFNKKLNKWFVKKMYSSFNPFLLSLILYSVQPLYTLFILTPLLPPSNWKFNLFIFWSLHWELAFLLCENNESIFCFDSIAYYDNVYSD